MQNKIKRRAEEAAKANVTTAVLFGAHFRWDYLPYFELLHDHIAATAEEFHKYGIELYDRHSVNLIHRYDTREEMRHVMLHSGPHIPFSPSREAAAISSLSIPIPHTEQFDRVAYIASKGGQLGLMRALALDLGPYNIRVNAVLPGMIKTDRWENNYNNCRSALSNYTPIGDIADFEDIANAVYYFGGDDSKNTTGAELVVDGGNTIQLYPIIPEN